MRGSRRSTARKIRAAAFSGGVRASLDRKSTRLNSSHQIISYTAFCLKNKKQEAGLAIRPLPPSPPAFAQRVRSRMRTAESGHGTARPDPASTHYHAYPAFASELPLLA